MNKEYKDKGKILISYGPTGMYALDTTSEIFLENFIKSRNYKINLITKPGTEKNNEYQFYPYGNYIWEGNISSDGRKIKIDGFYKKTKKYSLKRGIEKCRLTKFGFQKCGNCDNRAQYLYMGSSESFLYKDYYCISCVPKGDIGHNTYRNDINLQGQYKTDIGRDIMTGANLKVYVSTMADDDFIIPVDKNGNEYPSLEYFFKKEGFKK